MRRGKILRPKPAGWTKDASIEDVSYGVRLRLLRVLILHTNGYRISPDHLTGAIEALHRPCMPAIRDLGGIPIDGVRRRRLLELPIQVEIDPLHSGSLGCSDRNLVRH